MSVPESEIVSVTVSVNQQATTTGGFGLTCAFGESAILPFGQRFGLYADLEEVGAVFPTNSPEYLAAEVFFEADETGQTPDQLMIARMFTSATPAELISGAANSTVATYAAIANGSLDLNIDGTAETITGIALTGLGTMTAIASAIQTAIAADKAGFSVQWTGTQFILRSGTTGAASTLAFATPAGAGTDLAPLMALRQTDGAVLTQGVVAETLASSLANVLNLNPFYFAALAYAAPDADVETLATFVLANALVGGYVSAATAIATQGVTSDVASVLKATTNKRIFGMYDQLAQNPYAMMSIFAQASLIDFSGQDTTETMMFKQLPGVSVSPINTTMKKILDGKNINYYLNVGGNPMFATGVMADGSWFDQVQGIDWLSGALQSAIFGGLYANKKFPQSDRGMAALLHLLEIPLQQAVANGLIAPGQWNGAPVGQINTGDTLNKGYYTFAASVDTQSQTVRNSRVGPPIQVIAKGAGALQGINIILGFEE